MVQAYLRYEQAASFGVICSNSSVVYDRTGRLLITAALESIAIWNIKQCTLVRPTGQHRTVCQCMQPPFPPRRWCWRQPRPAMLPGAHLLWQSTAPDS